MNISGLLVHTRPERCTETSRRLAALPGVEVHGASPEGRLVVTVECNDDAGMHRTIDEVTRTDGVLSAALIYHHDEAVDD